MKAIVLVSGGLDSCTALAWARSPEGGKFDEILPISFAYGQRHSREIEACRQICEYYRLPEPRYFNLTQAFLMIGGSSLTSGVREGNPSTEVVNRTPSDLPPSFVPGRNMIMLSIAAALGYTERIEDIVGGWNAVDYSGYPDCRPEFMNAMMYAAEQALGYAPGSLQIHAPLIRLRKDDIIRMGVELKAPLHLTWSCYSGGTVPCGICDSCKIRAEGFKRLGLPDPAMA